MTDVTVVVVALSVSTISWVVKYKGVQPSRLTFGSRRACAPNLKKLGAQAKFLGAQAKNLGAQYVQVQIKIFLNRLSGVASFLVISCPTYN